MDGQTQTGGERDRQRLRCGLGLCLATIALAAETHGTASIPSSSPLAAPICPEIQRRHRSKVESIPSHSSHGCGGNDDGLTVAAR
ncbi:hypothetical protein BDA96_02G040900 [Sorghum bicolor]|uniref:Secreted protein n=1 Tax=Sorghum bicolor TaxID=4558 RepID=A0A921RK43_SORBI|nr:hypothetical protein BDA96_02G040900 [Sorghum bicolor]